MYSIESQTFEEFEIIIADDGSTDNSPELIKEFMINSKRPVFAILSKKNNGIVRNYNEALKMARGKYIAHIASDDYNSPARIAIQYNAIKQKDYSMIISGIKLIDSSGDLIKYGRPRQRCQSLDFALKSGAVRATSPTMLFDRELIDKYGLLPNELGNEDEALAFRALCKKGILVIDDYLVAYRKHITSVSAQQQKSSFFNYLKWLENNINYQILNKIHWKQVIDSSFEYEKASLAKSICDSIIEDLRSTQVYIASLDLERDRFKIIKELLISKRLKNIYLEYLKISLRSSIYKLMKISSKLSAKIYSV
jgi:glycosyltransferase involved in cell wall biosynthesis